MELEQDNKKKSKPIDDKYKGPSIYTKNVSLDKKKYSSSDLIEKLLNNEKEQVKEETWSRLSISDKIDKLDIFSIKFCKDNNILNKTDDLKKFLNETFKKRTKKEVVYNKKDAVIEEIVGLNYNNEQNKFVIIKQNRVSTSKNLPKISYSRKKKKNVTKKNNESKLDN